MDLVALAAGALLPLAFAPFGAWPVALAAPAALLAAVERAGARRGLWRGWLFGVGSFGAGVSWIHESFQFAQVAAPVAVVLTGALVALLALYPALLGALVARVAGGTRRWLPAVVFFPAAWVLVEWLRGWLFTGFTWLQLGYAMPDAPLAGALPVAGVHGAGWLAATAGAALLVGLRGGRRDRAAALVLVALVLGGTAALDTVRWTRPAGAALRVALVQGAVPQDQKWLPESRRPTMERYRALTRGHLDAARAVGLGIDLVVWPETALPGFYRSFAPFLHGVAAQARAHGADLLVGVPVADPRTGRYHNSVAQVAAEARFYHKRHLVPFGEYLPLASLLEGVVRFMQLPISAFSPGPPAPALLETAGHPIGVSICYEAAFGDEIRRTLPAAALLVNVSNDAWFGDSIAPHQHLQIARVRAIETGRWLLRATNTGISAIVGPDGAVRARGPQFEPAVVAGEAEPMRGATPYVRFGDAPVIVAAALAALLGAVAARRAS